MVADIDVSRSTDAVLGFLWQGEKTSVYKETPPLMCMFLIEKVLGSLRGEASSTEDPRSFDASSKYSTLSSTKCQTTAVDRSISHIIVH